MSGRDNIRQYMESLMGDDGNDDDSDDNNDDKDEKQTPAPKKDLNESKKAAEKAQESAAPQKSSMGTSSFNFDFSVDARERYFSKLAGVTEPESMLTDFSKMRKFTTYSIQVNS